MEEIDGPLLPLPESLKSLLTKAFDFLVKLSSILVVRSFAAFCSVFTGFQIVTHASSRLVQFLVSLEFLELGFDSIVVNRFNGCVGENFVGFVESEEKFCGG